jgi:ABC-type transporter Mla maintaining outer membrane lipid asymmetry ATPase subunit MlaF
MSSTETRPTRPVLGSRPGVTEIRASSNASASPPAERGDGGSHAACQKSRSPARLTQPTLLRLHEPTTGLDPRSKLEVQDFIREIRSTHDATILLCTHDLDEAEALADRIGILDDGRLLCLEPVDQLKRRYGDEKLEEAFFAATGKSFEDEKPEEDKK